MVNSAECSCKGKSLDRFLQPAILMLLYKREMHGFMLIQEISKTPLFMSDCPDPSGLYRYLKKMEAQGLLVSWEQQQEDFPSKRIYQITELGRECLKHWTNTLDEYVGRLATLAEELRVVISE